MEKQKNYISAVIYAGEEENLVAPFLQALTESLSSRFEFYELVFVNDYSKDGTVQAIKDFIDKMDSAPPVTLVNMSLRQGREMAMAAGIDMAIGDFVYEFDTMQLCYPEEYFEKAYSACVGGSDIVCVGPSKVRSASSSIFYKLFNSSSKSKYKLQTDAFYVLSRRAINRINTVSQNSPYRKAAYAASGLKMENITFNGKIANNGEQARLSKAFDSFALYTGLSYKVSLIIAAIMLFFTVAVGVYTLVIFIGGHKPIEGWTTTMLLISGGFFGIFLILSVVLKYLSLLLDLVFKKQKYLVESVEKISKG